MGKYRAVIGAVLLLISSTHCFAQAASAPAQTQPASKPTDAAVKLLDDVQAIAKIDAPGAPEFAAALAAVLKKHSASVPDALLKAKPSATLPKLTEAQIRAFFEKPASTLMEDIGQVWSKEDQPADGSLRIDMIEACCKYGPTMYMRLLGAERLLAYAPGISGEKGPRLGCTVEPQRAIDAAKAAVAESFAAAADGRDPFSMKTLVGLLAVKVSATMLGIDMMNLKDPTKESLQKAYKTWDDFFAGMEKSTKDENAIRALDNIRKYTSVELTDAQVDAFLLPSRCKPLGEAFFAALIKQDREAMKPLLAAKTAGKLAEADLKTAMMGMFGGTPAKVRIVSVSMHTGGPEQTVSARFNVIWTDENGKEHAAAPEMPVVKTEKGLLVGEK